MSRVWSIIAKSTNRQVISWIGGALVALLGAVWTVVTYVWPVHEAISPKIVCAQQGSIASGRDVSGSAINYAASSPPNSANGSSATCARLDEK
jgi:hypothetical protein